MDLVTPGIGLVFWTTLIFLMVLLILRVFAWKPILNALKVREDGIRGTLNAAEKTRAEMEKLKAGNEKILQEAKIEKDAILKEAKEMKEEIINEAKERTVEETKKMIEAARLKIEEHKLAAMSEIKEQIIVLSVEMAEKILREKLSTEEKNKEFLYRLMNDIKLN